MIMEIKGYVISVIAVSVVGALVSALSPEGEGGGLAKNVRLACGAVMIAACIAPISALLGFLSELDMGDLEPPSDKSEEYESIFMDGITDAERANLEDGIRAVLSREFGIDESECRVDVTLICSGKEMRLTRIFITLYGSAVWSDTGAIEKYLGELLECEIITAIG